MVLKEREELCLKENEMENIIIIYSFFLKFIDRIEKVAYNKIQLYMLSRVDERIGFMTPQQPII